MRPKLRHQEMQLVREVVVKGPMLRMESRTLIVEATTHAPTQSTKLKKGHGKTTERYSKLLKHHEDRSRQAVRMVSRSSANRFHFHGGCMTHFSKQYSRRTRSRAGPSARKICPRGVRSRCQTKRRSSIRGAQSQCLVKT